MLANNPQQLTATDSGRDSQETAKLLKYNNLKQLASELSTFRRDLKGSSITSHADAFASTSILNGESSAIGSDAYRS